VVQFVPANNREEFAQILRVLQSTELDVACSSRSAGRAIHLTGDTATLRSAVWYKISTFVGDFCLHVQEQNGGRNST